MTKKTSLNLADGLSLPLDAITRKFAILAVSGAGKSNLAAVMAEEMFAAELPFVVIDPKGDWSGLRSSRDGKGPGLAIPIFGGDPEHCDQTIDRYSGELVADLVISERLSCIVDISNFESDSAKHDFLFAFARRLYAKNKDPLHIFAEEADDYIPQSPFEKEKLLLHAWSTIVRRGRTRGLGVTMITQRSAVINKNVLTQAETLFALRTTSPQDRKAIRAWVDGYEGSEEIVKSLPSLGDGDFWCWSPDWLKKTVRVHAHRRSTFDSGATPIIGGTARRAPATLASINLPALTANWTKVIEKAKENDPKELKRQIVELKKELAAKVPAAPAAPKVERVEVPVSVLTDADRAALRDLGDPMRELIDEVQKLASCLSNWDHVREKILFHQNIAPPAPRPLPEAIQPRPVETLKEKAARLRQAPPTPEALMRTARLVAGVAEAIGDTAAAEMPDGLRRMLIALAQRPQGLTNKQLGVRAGLAISGTFSKYLAAARRDGLLEDRGVLRLITPAGIVAIGDYEPLPTGRELADYWLGRLEDGAQRMLRALLKVHPKTLSNDEIAEQAELAVSGTFSKYLARLRKLDLATGGRGATRASDELFDGGR